MAAQHAREGDYSTRYRFNGKEQDEATGFYYYGARYYEPSLSRWLSVDPLAEKYQGFSPYNYTLNNPINLVDPDGRFVSRTSAWWYKIWHGGGTIEKDKGGEYFVHKITSRVDIDSVDKLGMIFTDSSTFDWNGRRKGKDLAFEKAVENYITEMKFIKSMESAGYTVTRTNSRYDAIVSMLRPFTDVMMINTGGKAASLLLGRAARSGRKLLRAANVSSKNGLTAVGRALQKHGDRSGSLFPKAIGNPASINAQGEAVLKGIINNPNVSTLSRHHARLGNIVEYKLPSGQGARFSSDLKTFFGFIE